MRFNNKEWTRFLPYLYKYKKLQLFVFLLMLVQIPLGLATPYFTKLVIDRAYQQRDMKAFFILSGIGFVVFVSNSLISTFSSFLSQNINRNISFDITRDLYNRLQSMPLSFFSNHTTGESIYRVNSDARSVTDFVCGTVPQVLMMAPRFLFLVVIIFILNFKMALFAAFIFPFMWLQPFFLSRRLRGINAEIIQQMQKIFKRLQETFSQVILIKAMGMSEAERHRFEQQLKKRMDLELKRIKVSRIGSFIGGILDKVLIGVITFYGGYLVIKGDMTLGSLTAFMLYMRQFAGQFRSLASNYQSAVVSAVARHRVSQILDVPILSHYPTKNLSVDLKAPQITYENVVFGYKKRIPVFKGISFSIAPGTKAAVIGRSGSGKTTLMLLLLRLFEQTQGRILIDGMDIRDFDVDGFRSQMGVALQEPFLWNDTIANNIRYGAQTSCSFGQIQEVAKLAQAHEFIEELPNGYESRIGERACRLSQGQKQRIAVARALIRRPQLLIMDEALSSLDSAVEDRVIANIMKFLPESTTVFVSHRLSVVRQMDQIYFMDDGILKAVGDHVTLSRDQQGYRDLFASQMEYVNAVKG